MRQYDVLCNLGAGSFSYVSLVRERSTGHERVCKTVNTRGVDPKVLEWLRMEIRFLCNLDHPHIVKLFAYAEDRTMHHLVLILEYIAGDTCDNILLRSEPPNESVVAQIVRQTLVALAYCHAQGVEHRDIKLENIMLTRAPRWDHPDVKLIDFGLGRFAWSNSISPGDFVGTPQYMAPEIVGRMVVDFSKSDVWATGICALELITGRSPFGPATWEQRGPEDMERLYKRISSFQLFEADVLPVLQETCGWRALHGDMARNFISWLLQADRDERPAAAQTLEHPWLEQSRAIPVVGLPAEIIRSMGDYCAANPLMRSCLLILAARLGASNCERIDAAFLSLDKDEDGEVGFLDLENALANDANWIVPDIDVDNLFASADMDQSGGLSHTEFAATCLFAEYGTAEELIDLSFKVLDEDQDGTVQLQSIRELFREEEQRWLDQLPEEFHLREWRACFHGRRCPKRSAPLVPEGLPRPRADEPKSLFQSLLGHHWFCRGQRNHAVDEVAEFL